MCLWGGGSGQGDPAQSLASSSSRGQMLRGYKAKPGHYDTRTWAPQVFWGKENGHLQAKHTYKETQNEALEE